MKKERKPDKNVSHSLSTLYKKWYAILISALFVTLLVSAIKQIPLIQDVENRALDYRFRLYPIEQDKIDDVVLVAIDDSSLREFVNNRISWPWPREFYATAVDYFNTAGAKGVLFDVLFYEPDFNADEYDEMFAESMEAYSKTVIAALMMPDSTRVPGELRRFHLELPEEMKAAVPQTKGITAPIELFLSTSGSVGSVNIVPDSDGVIRRAPLFYRVGDTVLPQLPMGALFLPGSGYSLSDISMRNNRWYFQEKLLPMDKKGNYLINWYGEEGNNGVYSYYPFRAVIQSVIQHRRGMTPILPPETFKDKYVVIGATAPGLYDLKTTPISQIHPGMEIWASILNNFLNKDFVVLTPTYISYLYLFLLSFLLMFLFVRNPRKIGNYLNILLVALVLVLPIFLWVNSRIYLNLVSPLVAVVLSFMFITLISYVSEGRSKKEIKKAFSRYLHPQIIEQLVNNPDLVDLQGNEFDATMVFSDIANFTNFSEKTDPKTLIMLLNKYFETLTGTILDNDGMLDKFMGDGLMAVFGAPLATTTHSYNACKAAVTHKKAWQSYAHKQDEISDFSIMFHLNTRIGINTGPVVAGNMGSVRRVDYTVIGDAVNLAARLESINKYYGTDICISEHTFKEVKGQFICRELDSMKVKGKNEPTKIYELIDFAEPEIVSVYGWIDDYVEALSYYRKGNWDKAIDLFAKLAANPVSDKTSKIMLDRCRELKDNTPKDWDGVYKWEVK